ncbi:MAG TPA: SLC13 family permease, partial [Bacillota bacterium]|nr:SLC13 family permease [Bacillota bacterium]
GAAPLVGYTTSLLLGGHAGMDFLDFFVYRGMPGLFWIVQIGAIAATLVLVYVFRKYTEPIETLELTTVKDYFPSYLLVGMVVLLILASFIPNKPAITNGIITMSLFVVGLIRSYIKTKDFNSILSAVNEIDYFTILLLAGLFVVIAGITEAGVIDAISKLFVKVSGGNVFVIYTLIVWASVLFSAFIDNIPYVATMLPVTGYIASSLGLDPTLLYFGLLVGATLGGNLTPIGASANITALGILRNDGHEVSAGEFMKVSVPFTLAAVTTGYILVWLLWA